jgi:hypothetical protein
MPNVALRVTAAPWATQALRPMPRGLDLRLALHVSAPRSSKCGSQSRSTTSLAHRSARAARATRAYTRRAFPPETSGPLAATRPRLGRGLAPRRPGGWERLFLCERQRFAPSNRPRLLVRPMRVQNYLSAVASCAVRERQAAPSRFVTQGCAADGTADGPDSELCSHGPGPRRPPGRGGRPSR